MEPGAELLFALGYPKSQCVLTAVVGSIQWSIDAEGIKYAVGEYSRLMSAVDVEPIP